MKLVILDRDGVINFDSPQFIKSPAEWKPIPGSLHAIARLNQNGYHVVIVTNQSGIGRSLLDMEALNAIHEKMHKALFAVGGASTPSSIARIRPIRPVNAANPSPGCSSAFPKP